MVKVNILGSASGVPTKKRSCSSTAVLSAESGYLLDAGEPCSRLLVKEDIPYNSIKAVFISHMDPDHFSGIFMLVKLMALTGRKGPLKIYVPEEAVVKLKEFFRTVYLFDEILSFDYDVFPIKEGVFYHDENINIVGFPNTHMQKRLQTRYPQLPLESYSFVLKTADRTIGYSGDLGCIEDLETLVNMPLDLMIVELAHIEPASLMEFLGAKDIEKVIFTHIHPELEDREDDIRRLAEKFLKGRCSIAYDGLRMEV